MNELADPFPMSLQAVSKHLKVLERAGLVGPRPRQAAAAVAAAGRRAGGGHAVAGGYHVLWEDSFDRLGDHLRDTHEG